MSDPVVRIASFDVGKKNFAQYIEDVNTATLEELRNDYNSLPRSKQRRVKGPMNNEITVLLDAVYLCGTRVDMGVFDLRSAECVDAKSRGVDMKTRLNIVQHLEAYKYLYDTCDVFIVEQQFTSTFTPKGRRNPTMQSNIDAIKIGEIVMTWLMTHYRDKTIEHYGSQFKTQTLGAPNSLTKPQRKKWSVEKAREIFELREDTEALTQMTASKKGGQKQDDVADACIQCQSYKFRAMVAQF